MATTRFLSRLIGLAALILSAAIFIDKPPMLAAIDLMNQDRGVLYLLGVGGVVAGLAIVLTHNIWSQGLWPLVVTLAGWLILIRGVLVLVLPAATIGRIVDGLGYGRYFHWYGILPLLLGAYLTYCGFFHAVPDASGEPVPREAKPQDPDARGQGRRRRPK